MNGSKNIGCDYILEYGVVKALPTPLPFNATEEPKEDFYEEQRAESRY